MRGVGRMKNKQALFSSSSDEWSTPQNIFDLLNDEFNFNLDPCATKGNHKCSKWFEAAENGLLQNWGGVQSIL